MKNKKQKSWDITIQATVTKTIRIKGKNEQEAIEEAHGMFSVLNDKWQEKYTQEVTDVKRLE
jgi:hypothetical protein